MNLREIKARLATGEVQRWDDLAAMVAWVERARSYMDHTLPDCWADNMCSCGLDELLKEIEP